MSENEMCYPKISIITVSYNAVATIEQTILSVINQTYLNIEYIIIDGGSTDGTIDIIKKYKDKISYWVSEPDNGIYDAMNKGIDMATGEYIYFIGADDCLVDFEIMKTVAEYLEKAKDMDVLGGSVWCVDEQLGLQFPYKIQFDINDIYAGYRIPHQGTFIKRTILKKNHFNTAYKIVADYDLFLKLYFNRKIRMQYIDKKIAYYANSGVSSIQIEKRITEDIKVMQNYNIPKNVIEKYKMSYKKNYKAILKNILKRLVSALGMTRYLKKIRGWKEHSCSLNKCRWCGK